MSDNFNASPESAGESPWKWRVIRTLVVLILLGGTIGISVYWMKNRPQTKRRPRPDTAKLVQVQQIDPSELTVVIRAMGVVTPARQVELVSQVSGEIVQVSPKFVPGGLFAADAEMVLIDPVDYELAVKQKMGSLAAVECELKVEMGEQAVAAHEFKLLGDKVATEDKDLLLRKPQLAKATSALAAAEAALEDAKLDLARTRIAAPFNALVMSRGVDLGSLAGSGTPVATVVGTDEYWIEASVPIDELRWVDIPQTDEDTGSVVRVYHDSAWPEGVYRTGHVKRLMAELEAESRMARVLIAVSDPLDLKATDDKPRPLILGSYVSVAIEGQRVKDVTRVHRSSLRDGEKLWVKDADGKLDIREADVVYSDNEYVYLAGGLGENEALIVSDLSIPVKGMAVRLEGETAPADREGEAIAGKSERRRKREAGE